MKNTAKIIFTSLFICILCTSTNVLAKALPKTARIVPPETFLLVDIDDFSQLKTQFEKTSFYKLYKDPAMAAFIDNFKAKWREKTKEIDNEIAKAIIDADILPNARLSVALVPKSQPTNTGEPDVLFISQWGENISKINEAVDKLTEKAVADGVHLKTEDYRGIRIVTMITEFPATQAPGLSPSQSDQSNTPTIQRPPEKTYHCFIDDYLIWSTDLDTLKFVIAHIKGATSPTLASDADYTATTNTVGPYHDLDVYVNIKQIIKTVTGRDNTGMAKTMITNLGFDNVVSAGYSIGVNRCPDSSFCGKAFVKVNGAKRGICKMLETESAVVRTPQFIRTSTYSMTFWNFDISKAYHELNNIITSFKPAAAAIMYMPLPTASSPDEPGLKIKDDIIDHLGSQLIIAHSLNKPFSKDSIPSQWIAAMAINNRYALEKSMSLLYSKIIAPNNPDATRELLGHTIYTVRFPALPPFFSSRRLPLQSYTGPGTQRIFSDQFQQNPGNPQKPAFAFTITDTHLIFGTESEVERSIRSLSSAGPEPTASIKWFNIAKSANPSVVGLASLKNNTAAAESFWWALKQSEKAGTTETAVSIDWNFMFPEGGGDLFDFSLLPEFNVVRKYFGLSAFYGISRPDGFYFEFKDINWGGGN